jgi:hypothetical protein
VQLDASPYPAAAREVAWFRDLIDGTNAAENVPLDLRAVLALASADLANEQAAAERRRAESLAGIAGHVPRTDGVYFRKEADYGEYYRFYRDLRVVSISSTGRPSGVARWLRWGAELSSQGHYLVLGAEIEFDSTSTEGTVEYRGSFLSPEQLVLDWHSRINGYRGTGQLFTFHKARYMR